MKQTYFKPVVELLQECGICGSFAASSSVGGPLSFRSNRRHAGISSVKPLERFVGLVPESINQPRSGTHRLHGISQLAHSTRHATPFPTKPVVCNRYRDARTRGNGTSSISGKAFLRPSLRDVYLLNKLWLAQISALSSRAFLKSTSALSSCPMKNSVSPRLSQLLH